MSGYFFSLYNVTVGYVTLSRVFENLFSFLLLLVLPVLTMRLLSGRQTAEDRSGAADRSGHA